MTDVEIEKRVRKPISLYQEDWDRLAHVRDCLNREVDRSRFKKISLSDLIQAYIRQANPPTVGGKKVD